ncbi:MAG: hypothetical protein HYS07_11170 [Chlamydiae bacterium]|nr:hypothetical protein [Chlamydiota bacterium]MBI3278182.1 hypothetical protein [Chlamydiota bacterium]
MEKSYPFAFFLGYLFPGLGHFYMGKKGLGLFFFFAIVPLYGVGMMLGGGILWEEMNILTVLAYTVKFFNGVPFLLNLLQQLSHHFSYHEVGTTFILVSGSLNLLLLIHLIDVIREDRTSCQQAS